MVCQKKVRQTICVQFFLIGKYLDNSLISPYAPTVVDAADYVTRAQIWETEGFATAFGDAYRMPGYSLIIMYFVVPSSPHFVVRLVQVFGLALSVGLIKVLLERIISPWIAISGGILLFYRFGTLFQFYWRRV